MKNKLHRTLDLILNHFQILILLQIINQLIGLFFVYPLSNKMLNFAYQYQGKIILSNIQGFEVSLENVMLFLIVFVILGLYYVFLLSTSIVIANDLIQNNRPTLANSLDTFLRVIKQVSKKELFKTALVVAIVIPMSLMSVFYSAVIPLRIPEFILDTLNGSNYFNLVAIFFFILLNLYAIFLLFVLYDVFLQNKSFEKAHQSNFRFLKENARMISSGLLGIVITAGLLFATYLVSTFSLGLITQQFLNEINSKLVFNRVHSVLLFLFSSTLLIIGLSLLTLLIVDTKRKDLTFANPKISLGKQVVKVARNLLLLSFILSALFSINQQVNLETNPIEIIGHRIGILELPENSTLALDEAIKQSYDRVEIDVQQLKDQEILVVHDSHFKRLAGSNLKVVDATYEDILTLDPLYTHPQLQVPNQRFATLDDFAQMAKNKINLMIEVKTNPEDNHLLEDIFAIIEKYDLFEQVELASMDKKLLKEIKKLNQNVETTYIATAVIGDKLKDDYIDNYSLQLDLLTNDVIKKIRSQEKKLYVWTPNTSATITEALQLDIDGIVTDRPALVKFHIQNPNYRLLDQFWNQFFFKEQDEIDYPDFNA